MFQGPRYLGLDMGGTTVKVGAYDQFDLFEPFGLLPTPSLEDPARCVRFAGDVRALAATHGVSPDEVVAVGLAIPGVADEHAEVGLAPNVTLDLKATLDSLASVFPDAQLYHLNDANAAALGEWSAIEADARQAADAAAAGATATAPTAAAPVPDSMLFVTLGTGVGAGLVADGRVLAGAHGAAGEIGHLRVVPEGGRVCNCGGQGCLERYVSSGGLVLTFREIAACSAEPTSCAPAHDRDAAAVFHAAADGDGCATRAVERFSATLGAALAQAACVFDPGLIVLGGGLAASADLYLDDVRRAFEAAAIDVCAKTPIVAARLGNDAGMRGAAAFALTAAKDA